MFHQYWRTCWHLQTFYVLVTTSSIMDLALVVHEFVPSFLGQTSYALSTIVAYGFRSTIEPRKLCFKTHHCVLCPKRKCLTFQKMDFHTWRVCSILSHECFCTNVRRHCLYTLLNNNGPPEALRPPLGDLFRKRFF